MTHYNNFMQVFNVGTKVYKQSETWKEKVEFMRVSRASREVALNTQGDHAYYLNSPKIYKEKHRLFCRTTATMYLNKINLDIYLCMRNLLMEQAMCSNIILHYVEKNDEAQMRRVRELKKLCEKHGVKLATKD